MLNPSHPWTTRQVLAAVAPVLLCAVAVLHFCGVVFADLSAWKGGGFGMFSTVDAPHARFLRVALVTEDGETAIVLPPRWTKEVRKIRTMPTARRIAELGRALLASNWTHYEIVSSQEQYRIALEAETGARTSSEAGLADRHARLDLTPFGFVQTVEDLESERRSTELIEVQAVRIEVWHYRFDQASGTLQAEVLRNATFSKPA